MKISDNPRDGIPLSPPGLLERMFNHWPIHLPLTDHTVDDSWLAKSICRKIAESTEGNFDDKYIDCYVNLNSAEYAYLESMVPPR